jgi:Cu-Zn family superoxide dismutase
MTKKTRTRLIGSLFCCSFFVVGGALANGCSSDPPSGVTGGNDSGPSRTDSGPGQDSSQPDTGASDSSTTLTAKATLEAVGDSGVSGTATFTESNGTVTLNATVQGARPGTHGLHVHLGTTCAAPGPHYGPDGGPYHGEWKVVVGDAGTGSLTVPNVDVTVSAGQWVAVGHAMVFHHLATPDAGADAGPPPRAACGVVQ